MNLPGAEQARKDRKGVRSLRAVTSRARPLLVRGPLRGVHPPYTSQSSGRASYFLLHHPVLIILHHHDAKAHAHARIKRSRTTRLPLSYQPRFAQERTGTAPSLMRLMMMAPHQQAPHHHFPSFPSISPSAISPTFTPNSKPSDLAAGLALAQLARRSRSAPHLGVEG